MNEFLATVAHVNDVINNFVWVKIGLILLLGTGIIMTCLTGFFQVSHFRHWWKHTIGELFNKESDSKDKSDKHNISQFQSLCTALAATVGVGNIAGVASAIVAGGAGSIFWMWIAAFFGMMTNYSENVLGIYYRRKNERGEWCGGPMYYLRDGLGRHKNCKTLGAVLAVAFCIFCLFASFGIGNLSQNNTIAVNLNAAFNVPTWVTGIGIVIVAALVIIGGIKRIAAVTEKIVPFMVALYMIGALVIFFSNIQSAGLVFKSIFGCAFGIKAVEGGFVGVTVKSVITWGFKRGVFSNEAGLGSSVMVHSCSNVREPVRQGMWGIFEVFADTIVVCTLTAFVILSSGVVDPATGTVLVTGADGVALEKTALVGAAFSTVFGKFGTGFIAIAVMLFAFSTTLGWSVYGSKAWEYLFGRKSVIGYKIFFVLMCFVGPQLTSSLAWDISDTFNGMMMIPNLIGVLVLSPEVYKITRNYIARHIHGKEEKPILSSFEDVQKDMEKIL
ncbi:MAG: alanine/glycine:cation symporter family protein [Lachnobacterium sp.]|nr:alanine/glycine:cation symporter family protein [Lachnobacterium sp.]